MADPFQKLKPGDRLRIPAELYSLLVDMAQEYAAKRGDFEALPAVVGHNVELKIRNEATTPLAQFAVVRIGADLIVPADAKTSFFGPIIFKAAAPAAGQPFAVLQLPAAAAGAGTPATPPGGIVGGIAAGETMVRVDAVNVGHTYADVIAGDKAKLRSQAAAGPAEVLWPRPFPSVGQHWAYVRLGNTPPAAAGGGGTLPGFAAAHMGAQVIVGGTQTYNGFGTVSTVSFDTVKFDTAGCYSAAFPTRLTAQADGYYLIMAFAGISYTGSLTANGMVHLCLKKTHGFAGPSIRVASQVCPVNTVPNPNLYPMMLNFTGLQYLDTGDYLEMQIDNETLNVFQSGAGGGPVTFTMCQIATP